MIRGETTTVQLKTEGDAQNMGDVSREDDMAAHNQRIALIKKTLKKPWIEAVSHVENVYIRLNVLCNNFLIPINMLNRFLGSKKNTGYLLTSSLRPASVLLIALVLLPPYCFSRSPVLSILTYTRLVSLNFCAFQLKFCGLLKLTRQFMSMHEWCGKLLFV